MRRRLANRRSTILYRKEVKTDDTEVISWVFLLKKLSDERLSISNPLAVCNGLARKGVTHLVPCRFSQHMSMFCTLWWATLCQLEDMLSRILLGSSNIISKWTCFWSWMFCNWLSLLTIYVAHSHFLLEVSLYHSFSLVREVDFHLRCLYRRIGFTQRITECLSVEEVREEIYHDRDSAWCLLLQLSCKAYYSWLKIGSFLCNRG